MNFRHLLFAICKFFLLIHFVVGQPPNNHRFLPIAVNDQLPHSDITSIMQDRHGFLWFGTYGGLCRYDGSQLHTFSMEKGNPNALSNSRVLCLKELKDGSILIGTEGGGLNHFFPKTQSFRAYQASNGAGGEVILAIQQTSDNAIWIGTNTGLDLMQIKNGSAHFERVFNSPEGVAAIAEDPKGNVLFTSGLHVFEMKQGSKFYSLRVECEGVVNTILPIDQNQWLIGAESGLYAMDETNIRMIVNYRVIAAYQAHDSAVWIGTRGYGLLKINRKLQIVNRFTANKSDPSSLTFDEVSCLHEDHSGVLWVGTYGRGLNKLDLMAKQFELYSNHPWENNSLGGDRVISFLEDSQQRIWIGLRGNGINILDANNKINNISGKNGSPFFGISVSSFFEDVKGALWIGMWGGGIVVLPKGNIPELLNGGRPAFKTLLTGNTSVEKIIADDDGHIWISTTTGLLRYIPGRADYYRGEFRTFSANDPEAPLTDSFIRDIYVEKDRQDGEKIVWVGTRNGLNRLAINGAKHRVWQIRSTPSDPLSLPSDFVSVIMEDRQGALWLSCLGGGIAKMIAGRDGKQPVKFKVYNKTNGLLNNDIETILEDEQGYFWMGGYGLTKFDPQTGDLVGFDLNDGLQSNAFKVWAALKTTDGKMVFGGTKGFNIFRPREIQVNKIPPILTFTDLKVNNKTVSPLTEIEGYNILDSSILMTRHIELPYQLNSFTISFGAIHYTSPENNQLKYKLEGVDTDWLQAQGSEASRNYSQLKPGNYTFTFTGANSDNVWASQPLALTITIQKPYWATHYAIFLYVLVVLGFLLIFRKYSIIKVKEIGEMKMERMRRNQGEELSRLKINFYTEVSHELRTPLSLIKGPIFDILANPSLDMRNRKKLEVAGKNVERIATLVDEIMLFTEYGTEVVRIKATQADIIKFLNEISLFFSAEAVRRNIHFHLDTDQSECLMYFDRAKLEKVFFNLLSNAFKFTPERGTIKITAHKAPEPDRIRFAVFNSGKPIPDQDITHIFELFYTTHAAKTKGHGVGLFLAHQMVEQHHGKLWVENQPHGVTFFVELLLGKNHFGTADCTEDSADSESLLPNDERNSDSEQPEAKDKTVLIVEDHAELRNYLAEYMAHHFQVLTAANGKAGMAQAEQHQPDLIISDLMMPVMDGLSMCRKLKADLQTSHIPIIMLTARTSLKQQIDGYELGADDYVTKPFHARLLLAKANNLIASRKKLRELLRSNADFSPKEITVTSLDERIIAKTIEIIEKYIDDTTFSVDKLCKEIGISRPQLYRKIKALTSYSINGFIRFIRLKRAAQLLKQDNSSVTVVMQQVGFENQSYFSKAFKEQFGINPKHYTKDPLT